MEQEENTLWSKWLAGTITPKERAALAQKVDLDQLESVLAQQKAFELSVQPVEQMWKDFEQRQSKDKDVAARPQTRYRATQWLVAVLVLLGLIAAVAYYLGTKPDKIETAPGESTIKVFAEGTKVELSPGSVLSFKEESWKEERSLSLQGQAFFDVSKGKPMTIYTPQGKIAVLGTQFDIWEMEDQLRVQCFEGKVSVSAGGKKAILKAKEWVSLNKNTLSAVGTFSQAEPDWKRQERVYQKIPLPLVLQDIERFYAIRFEAAVALHDDFSGVIPTQDLEKALAYLAQSMNWQYERKGKIIQLRTATE